MKSKVILSVILAGILTASVLAGCTTKKDEGSSSAPSSAPSSSAPAKTESGKLKSVHEAVVAIFGENYIPAEMDATYLEQMIGVKPDLCKEYFVDAPMMNVQVDTFVGIEAAEGKADEVEAALKAYQAKFLADKKEFPYLPDHLPKAEAAQVVRVDDYVFYVMLADTAELEEATEADMTAAIKEQVQKCVDTIKDTLKK